MLLNLFETETGTLQAEVEAPNQVLGWYLTQELQADEAVCQDLLDHIQTIRGGADGWEEVGNAHEIVLTPQQAQIRSLFGDPPPACQLSLNELEEAVTRWLEFVRQG